MGKAPGRSERKGISLLELLEMFPDEKAGLPMVRDNPLARWRAFLSSLRLHEQPRG